MKLWELVKANYETYKSTSNGTQERHRLRLVAVFLVSSLLAIFSSDPSTAYPMMVTGITILTGFTFTALFSNHILADVGLPKPLDESDRLDLLRLEALSKNFKARSSYFILLSIIDAMLLIAASLKFSIPNFILETVKKASSYLGISGDATFFNFTSLASIGFSEVFFIFVTFIFLECLYTFFRLSETIIAIVDIRSDYIKNDERRS